MLWQDSRMPSFAADGSPVAYWLTGRYSPPRPYRAEPTTDPAIWATRRLSLDDTCRNSNERIIYVDSRWDETENILLDQWTPEGHALVAFTTADAWESHSERRVAQNIGGAVAASLSNGDILTASCSQHCDWDGQIEIKQLPADGSPAVLLTTVGAPLETSGALSACFGSTIAARRSCCWPMRTIRGPL
ncbi:MAG: hypothetical protein HYV63_13735 [Candidatus Schekmanbacteria bacterium]|nr:hypothetical protein [Candidatus Schekmanbacteria bacterium]